MLLHYQIFPVLQFQKSIIIAKAVSICPGVDMKMGMELKSYSQLQQLHFGHHPPGLRSQALSQHPPIIFQDQVDPVNLFTFLPLEPVVVFVLIARIAEFLIRPAAKRLPAGEALV